MDRNANEPQGSVSSAAAPAETAVQKLCNLVPHDIADLGQDLFLAMH
jgi:hypothetical protein